MDRPEPVEITVKKPIWSTEVVTMDGTGAIIHNYADGTNSGPLPIDRRGPMPVWLGKPGYFSRAIRGDKDDPVIKLMEEINGNLSQDSDAIQASLRGTQEGEDDSR